MRFPSPSLYRNSSSEGYSLILSAADRGEVTLLGLLDMSAAFDTVDHDILLQRLIGIIWVRWLRSQLAVFLSQWENTTGRS